MGSNRASVADNTVHADSSALNKTPLQSRLWTSLHRYLHTSKVTISYFLIIHDLRLSSKEHIPGFTSKKSKQVSVCRHMKTFPQLIAYSFNLTIFKWGQTGLQAMCHTFSLLYFIFFRTICNWVLKYNTIKRIVFVGKKNRENYWRWPV